MKWLIRVLILGAMTGCSAFAELPVESEQNEPIVAAIVGGMLENYHYASHPIDDKTAVLWMDAYINSLDFNHSIFLASDVEEFRHLAMQIDDDINSRKPNLATSHLVFNRYEQRLKERVAAATAMLDQPVDLTNDEDYVYDRTELEFPKDAAAANDLWRKRIEEQFILGSLQKRSEDDTRDLLRKRYRRYEHDVATMEGIDVLERYLTALTTVYDPHTIYFKPASQDNFDIEMRNSLEGIGASLRTMGEYTVVMDLIAGGPAEKGEQLKPGDKIIAVAQGDGEPVDILDLRIDKVVKQIRGKKGTEVRLTVIPSDAADPSVTKVISIVRDKVVLEDSDAEFKIHKVGKRQFAVIDVPSFYADPRGNRSASTDLERILKKEMGEVDGVILDLRHNGGGSLMEAVDMTGLFIDRGPVVQIRDGDGGLETLQDKNPKQAWKGPLMVLTSPLSASASEIVAGAIQDYGRGIIVGSEKTHGKGTVQTVIDLDRYVSRFGHSGPAGALKLTTQKFYRINGESTQVRGVHADVVIPSPWDGLDFYEGDLKHALKWDTIPATQYDTLGDLSASISKLQKLSTPRVQSSEGFIKMAEDRKERDKIRAEKKVSLKLSTRLENSKDDPAVEDGEKEKDRPDPVLEEALSVMADYVAIDIAKVK